MGRKGEACGRLRGGGGCEEEKGRASAGAGDRGEPVPRVLNLLSATPARERSGPLTTLVLAAHALVRAAPALVLAFDRLVPRHCRPGRAQGACEARLGIPSHEGSSRAASVLDASLGASCSMLECPRPRRSRSNGRRRAATRAGGAAAGPRTCTYLNLMWLAVCLYMSLSVCIFPQPPAFAHIPFPSHPSS